jgi:hypothetical protein
VDYRDETFEKDWRGPLATGTLVVNLTPCRCERKHCRFEIKTFSLSSQSAQSLDDAERRFYQMDLIAVCGQAVFGYR